MLMPKNSVKQKHWMDFHLDVFSNPWLNHKITRFILNPLGSLVALKTFGLVSNANLGVHSTQAAEVYWNTKIGTQVNQKMTYMTVSICLMHIGIIMIATTRLFSFVSLTKDHLSDHFLITLIPESSKFANIF